MSEFQIIIWSLVFSAFFSGLEIAFIRSSRLKLELEKKGSSSPWLYNIYRQPSKMIASLLLGNNIALVIYGFAISDALQQPITDFIGSNNEFILLLLQTLVSTIIILVFAEFIPKAIFSINPNQTLKFFSIPAFILYYLFSPIVVFIYWLAKNIIRLLFGIRVKGESNTFSANELNELVQDINDVEESIAIGDSEKEIFKNAIEFRTVKIRDCMIPRTDMASIDVNDELETLKSLFVKTGHSKVVVYNDNIDNIIGYVHNFDLFHTPQNIQAILRPIDYLPETISAQTVLSMLIKKNKTIAVVVDEFGGTSGLVTLEDVMEEIFGEIEDEHDRDNIVHKKLKENEYVFSGRIEIDFINEKYQLKIPEGDDYETLAGYLIINSGSIPKPGEIIKLREYSFTILKATENRIETIKVTLIP
jgi:CBS domain containing-hemolysin-like protein